MYVVVITSDSCDPFINGSIFKNEKKAEEFLKKYQSKWTERDWDTYEGHVLEINAQAIKYRVHGANGYMFICGHTLIICNHSECVYINT